MDFLPNLSYKLDIPGYLPGKTLISGIVRLDRQDRRILTALQKDSSRSIADLAEEVGVSSSACHRRIKALEATGLIIGYAAQVDPDKLGLRLRAFVEITLTSQSREAMDRFEQAAADFEDILECHLMSGNADCST